MVKNLDFGQDDSRESSTDTSAPTAFTFTCDGTRQTVYLLSGDTIRCGRNSEQDICLRIQPTSEEENAQQTNMISREHFRLQYRDHTVSIEDANSTRGTRLANRSLKPSVSASVSGGDHIEVGGVLELQLEEFASLENPEQIGCCLISRLNNLPNEKYLWVIANAKLGTAADAVIRVTAERPRRSLGLDFGGASESHCDVDLRWNDKHELIVECHGKQVLLNSNSLQDGESKTIGANDQLVVAGTIFSFE